MSKPSSIETKIAENMEDQAKYMSRPRIDQHDYFMGIADLVKERSTCLRRQVGAVAVLGGRIIATGYNGAPARMEHCTPATCIRTLNNIPSGTSLETCVALHAEANLLVQCAKHGVSMEGATVYVTHSPCTSCMKLLMGVEISSLIFKESYPDAYTLELLERGHYTKEVLPGWGYTHYRRTLSHRYQIEQLGRSLLDGGDII